MPRERAKRARREPGRGRRERAQPHGLASRGCPVTTCDGSAASVRLGTPRSRRRRAHTASGRWVGRVEACATLWTSVTVFRIVCRACVRLAVPARAFHACANSSRLWRGVSKRGCRGRVGGWHAVSRGWQCEHSSCATVTPRQSVAPVRECGVWSVFARVPRRSLARLALALSFRLVSLALGSLQDRLTLTASMARPHHSRTALAAFLVALVALVCTLAPAHAQKEDVRPTPVAPLPAPRARWS